MQHEIKKHDRAIAICNGIVECDKRIERYRRAAKFYSASRHPNANELHYYYQYLMYRYTDLKNYLLTKYNTNYKCSTTSTPTP